MEFLDERPDRVRVAPSIDPRAMDFLRLEYVRLWRWDVRSVMPCSLKGAQGPLSTDNVEC